MVLYCTYKALYIHARYRFTLLSLLNSFKVILSIHDVRGVTDLAVFHRNLMFCRFLALLRCIVTVVYIYLYCVFYSWYQFQHLLGVILLRNKFTLCVSLNKLQVRGNKYGTNPNQHAYYFQMIVTSLGLVIHALLTLS